MKIGDLAERVGVSVETIRFYEQKGLLPAPGRTSGNFREYAEEHLERLTFLRHCRTLDLSHREIEVLLGCLDHPDAPCQPVNAVVDAHLAEVTRRIADLRALEATLTELRGRCEGPTLAADCGILQGLSHRVRA